MHVQAERDTIKEREALEREEESALERERQRLEQRKLQTKEIVVDTIAKEEAAARAAAEVRSDMYSACPACMPRNAGALQVHTPGLTCLLVCHGTQNSVQESCQCCRETCG